MPLSKSVIQEWYNLLPAKHVRIYVSDEKNKTP